MKRAFVVSLEMPKFVSNAELIEYITDAVGSWKGGLDPNEDLYRLDRETVTVRKLAKVEREEVDD